MPRVTGSNILAADPDPSGHLSYEYLGNAGNDSTHEVMALHSQFMLTPGLTLFMNSSEVQ